MKETEKENSKNQPLQNPAQIPPVPLAPEADKKVEKPETGEQLKVDAPEADATKEENAKINDIDTITDESEEEIEFTKKVSASEKIHYETIINANKKTITALREENIGLHAEKDALTKQVAELTFLSNDSNTKQE